MNIETGKTPTEQDYISFKNKYNEKVTLVAGEESLRCAIREDGDTSMRERSMHFTRDEVKAILPYLQAYAETGTFDLSRLELCLQELEKARRGKAYYMRQLHGQIDYIAELEELLEEWKKYGQGISGSKHPDELVHLTEQLLEEGVNY